MSMDEKFGSGKKLDGKTSRRCEFTTNGFISVSSPAPERGVPRQGFPERVGVGPDADAPAGE